MDHFNSDSSPDAFKMISEAADGIDISDSYNSLSELDQRHVFSQMQGLQSSRDTMKLFGNLELIDSNRDGIMDDAKSFQPDGSTKDVYDHGRQAADHNQPGDRPQQLTQAQISRDPYLLQADRFLAQASRGRDIYNRYDRFRNDPDMLESMRDVQAAKPQYDNVDLIDENGDGLLDDVRATVDSRQGATEIDVYKTPADRVQERVKNRADRALRRGGEIVVDEIFRGNRRSGRGPGISDRILDRIGRESGRGAHRVLKDILRRR